MSSFASSLPLRLCTGLALLVAPTLLGARGCTGESHEVCATEHAPVCGADGTTYGNACEADRAGVEIAHDGACELACYELYAPVCGDDGVTYPNDCYAARAGAAVTRIGACECPAVLCDVYCEFGNAIDPSTGCESCACNPPPLCEPVLCTLYCEHGFATDPATGCETCACSEPEPICPPVLCDLYCEHGFATDPATGCETCSCNPEPTYCASDAECAEGERCEPLACPAICAIPEDGGPEECFFDCPPGLCVSATPPPPPPPTGCSTDADCLEGQSCLLYDCACLHDGPCDCLGGGVCEWLEGDPSAPPMGL